MTCRAFCRMLVSVILASLVAGCVPPKAVATYATAASKATAGFPPIARDMHASCLRFQAFSAQRRGDGWYDESTLRGRCAARDTAVAAVLSVNRVLSAYFSALSALADDKIVSADKELGTLATTLVSKAGMNQGQVSAVRAVVDYLSSGVMDGRRRSALTRAITTQNSNVTLIADGLDEIVQRDFQQILRTEEQGTNSFYRAVLLEGRDREPVAAALLMDQRDDRVAALKTRQANLDDYRKALGTIKSGHHKLYASRNNLKAKALAGELADHAKSLEKIAQQLEKAF
ncbi:MAG TPA: hypothetical protein VM939_07620 [Gemmatimonadaceae bacterium]|nr:hypothetical protein [Gemmatimonadaceae bacterium]